MLETAESFDPNVRTRCQVFTDILSNIQQYYNVKNCSELFALSHTLLEHSHCVIKECTVKNNVNVSTLYDPLITDIAFYKPNLITTLKFQQIKPLYLQYVKLPIYMIYQTLV